MKFRKSFVTNSSSSSYICDICGCTEAGYDCSAEDVGMYECTNGHTMCQDHLKDNKKRADKNDLLDKLNKTVARHSESLKKEKLDSGSIPYLQRWLAQAEKDLATALALNENDDNYEDDLYNLCESYELNYYLAESQCPICKMDVVSRDDIISYFFKVHDMTNEKLTKEIKEKFKTYDDLSKFLRNK